VIACFPPRPATIVLRDRLDGNVHDHFRKKPLGALVAWPSTATFTSPDGTLVSVKLPCESEHLVHRARMKTSHGRSKAGASSPVCSVWSDRHGRHRTSWVRDRPGSATLPVIVVLGTTVQPSQSSGSVRCQQLLCRPHQGTSRQRSRIFRPRREA
jgi:hypothetical protein